MTETILALLIALRAVESSDGLDPKANGNDYQITKVCVEDVNRIYGTNYHWPECVKFRENAENIIVLYLSYYGMQYFKRTGHIPSHYEFARIFHEGPTGAARGRGHAYAKKAVKILKKRRPKKAAWGCGVRTWKAGEENR